MSLDRLLRRQGGVVALRQAVALGMSTQTVQRKAREGSWQRLHPSVYLVGGHRLTDEARVRAAWLWAGTDATVSGASAAYWHGMLERAPREIDVTVPRRCKPRGRPGIRVRRRDLQTVDRVGLRHVWLTAAPLSALETATALADGSVFLDRALQRHVRFPTMYARSVATWAGAGRPRRVASSSPPQTAPTPAAERLLVRLLRDAGITGWVLGYPFGPWRIDLAFPQQKVAVEVDGWAWHVDAERFRNDRRKQNALVRDRWDPLRFTWHDLDGRPTEVVGEIWETLAAAA